MNDQSPNPYEHRHRLCVLCGYQSTAIDPLDGSKTMEFIDTTFTWEMVGHFRTAHPEIICDYQTLVAHSTLGDVHGNCHGSNN